MNEPLLLPEPKKKRVTLEQYCGRGSCFHNVSVELPCEDCKNLKFIPGQVLKIEKVYPYISPLPKVVDSIMKHQMGIPADCIELCTVFVQENPPMPPTPIRVVAERQLAIKIVKGEESIDALDSLFQGLRPEIKQFVKATVQAHIERFKKALK